MKGYQNFIMYFSSNFLCYVSVVDNEKKYSRQWVNCHKTKFDVPTRCYPQAAIKLTDYNRSLKSSI